MKSDCYFWHPSGHTILFLDRFIIQDLDELHLFVASDVAQLLQQKLDDLMEKNSYSEFEQWISV